MSHNCFARPTHTYLDFDAGRDFEREIVVKVNTPEVARAELMKPSWKREHVALGTNTDPYQWVEKKYELLPGVWEAMRDSRTPSSVLTKSPLLLRDIELFKQIPSFAANLSIPTLDEKAWRASEPHTPHPRKRIEAVAELNRAGIPTGVLIAPLMPGINDSPEQVEEILELCAEAGAVSIGGICLHLRGEVREVFMDWLRSYRPDLVPRYEALYARGAYAPKAERERLSRLVRGGRRVDGAAPRPGWRSASTQRGREPHGRPAAGAGHAVLGTEPRRAAPGPAATVGSPPQALGQPELLQLAHVALEGQLLAAERGAPGRSARTSGCSAIRSSVARVHGPCGLARRGAPAGSRSSSSSAASRSARSRSAGAGPRPAQCSSMRQIGASPRSSSSANSSSRDAWPAAGGLGGGDVGALTGSHRVDRQLAHDRALASPRRGRAGGPSGGRRA